MFIRSREVGSRHSNPPPQTESSNFPCPTAYPVSRPSRSRGHCYPFLAPARCWAPWAPRRLLVAQVSRPSSADFLPRQPRYLGRWVATSKPSALVDEAARSPDLYNDLPGLMSFAMRPRAQWEALHSADGSPPPRILNPQDLSSYMCST